MPEETKDHIDENASVRGLVEQVSFSQKGDAFLNFGGKYPQQIFTGFVPVQRVNAVGGEKLLKALAGNPVTVTGKIELNKRPTGNRDFVASADRKGVSESKVMEERRPLRRQPDDHHFGSLLMLAVTAAAFLLVVWVAKKALFVFFQESPIP